jgi:glutamate synthase (NADPH/NADH) small chain
VAKQPMLKFVTVERDMPEKRSADVRNEDFLEIYAPFIKTKAEEQASRSSQ